MADRYFDRNGATTGFGTLTGAWDTTTASWSTSAAGTATPTAFTFTSADAALFGAVGTTAVAGTATIAAGLNVSLNAVKTANLAALQTIAAGAGGTLTLGGTSPTIEVASAGGLSITCVMAGTGGFTKAGANALTLTAANTLSGAVTITRGSIFFGSSIASNNVLPNVTGFDFAPAVGELARIYYVGNNAFTENRAMSVSGSALGAVLITGTSAIITFGNASSVTTFAGFFLAYVDGTVTSSQFNFGANVPETSFRFRADDYSTTSLTRTTTFVIAPSSPVTLLGELYLLAVNGVSGHVLVFANNGTATTSFANATAIQKIAAGGGTNPQNSSQTIRFSGTNTATTTLQGDILQAANQGTLSLDKTMAGRLVLQGTNALSGSITVSAGVLEVQNLAGLGAATASGVTTSGTGQIELTAGGTYNKSGTNFTIHASNPIVSVGDNVLQTLGITLSGTAAFTVDAGNKLTISPQGAGVISGAFGITKNGDGELELTAKANTFTGQVTVNAGTLTIGSVADALGQATWGTGALAPIVEVSGTLKYTGGTARTTRSVRLNGSSPKLDASGTGDVTFATALLGTGTKTITLQGSNTDPNTIESALIDQSGTTTLVKDGAGKWVLQGSLSYTGTTGVNNGTLRVETANSNTTSGVVTIGASGTVELITDTLASSGATAGEVLGTGNVTVNGGTIKTRGGTTQKGQVRYGGNLTFGSGSTLYIGAAA